MKRLDYARAPKEAFGRIHFIGIGGSGMSGIAEVLCKLGYSVSGSDVHATKALQRLNDMGAKTSVGHDASLVHGADVVVVSSAIPTHNVEWVEAKKQRIPVVPRAEMLAELMRFKRGIAIAGTHGKTTTTSLVATVLGAGGLDPTFVIGGQLLAAGAHAGVGEGDWLVAEADESDRSFLRLTPTMAVVTNIDPDHLENYGGDFSRVCAAFDEFLHRLPFYGLAVLCIDDPEVRSLMERTARHVLSYGLSDDADVRATDVRQDQTRTQFMLHLPDDSTQQVTLNMPGEHNVCNALAAAAIAWQLAVPGAVIAQALSDFQGIGRRFNVLGSIPKDDGDVLVVDDYGHHPNELKAVFKAVRAGWPDRRLVAVFQPHRYTRTHELLDDFASVLSETDAVVVTEVYAAGEAPMANADGRALTRAIRARGKNDPVFCEELADLGDTVDHLLAAGDLVLFLGAGSIGKAVQTYHQERMA